MVTRQKARELGAESVAFLRRAVSLREWARPSGVKYNFRTDYRWVASSKLAGLETATGDGQDIGGAPTA
jgi:hypothetical protein